MSRIYYVRDSKGPHCYYKEYIEKHGYHFSDKLAEHASDMLKNADGSKHTWKASEVEQALKQLAFIQPGNATIGDLTYLANMYYSDFYPEVLKSENDCIKAAVATARDSDGYEGMAFKRWMFDTEERKHKIDFKDLV